MHNYYTDPAAYSARSTPSSDAEWSDAWLTPTEAKAARNAARATDARRTPASPRQRPTRYTPSQRHRYHHPIHLFRDCTSIALATSALIGLAIMFGWLATITNP